jgi:periplasmic protein TonB
MPKKEAHMFEDCLLESAGKIRTKKTRTVALSATVHGVLIAILILVPLVFTDQIEGAKLTSILVEPPPAPLGPPPGPAASVSVARAPAQMTRQADSSALIEPKEIPKEIAPIVDLNSDGTGPIGIPGGFQNGPGIGLGGGGRFPFGRPTEGAAPPFTPPPPPPPPTPPVPPPSIKHSEPVRIGGDVQAGKVIYQPAPAYPSLARVARVEGVVVLQAAIAADGTIQTLKVISETSPLLRSGVIETVKTWKYKPTLLNNEPVEVITTITINFSLQRGGQ